MAVYFVSGIGTGIGKSLVSAILCRALDAAYWKPVQAGMEDTDSDLIRRYNPSTIIHPEVYRLHKPASPHLGAREENININIQHIVDHFPAKSANLIIEGPGGLFVPLNETAFVTDLIRKLGCRLILVSRNYLGSINHSLLTAKLCKHEGLEVAGWIFNDQYENYEQDIVRWSGLPLLGTIPFTDRVTDEFLTQQAVRLRKTAACL